MKLFIVFTAVLLILSSCVDQEKLQLKKDLASCQVMVVYLTCLDTKEEVECNDWLCGQYPDAVVCEK